MTTSMPVLNGWLPDAGQPQADPSKDLKFEDHSDKVEALGAAAPQQILEVNGVLDLRCFCSPVEFQQSLPACVGNAVVGGLEFLQIREGKQPFVDLSRMFTWYNARLMTQDQDKLVGTYIRLAMGNLSSLGTCSEKTWQYDETKSFVRPSWTAYREA